jgi:hypothetical protein
MPRPRDSKTQKHQNAAAAHDALARAHSEETASFSQADDVGPDTANNDDTAGMHCSDRAAPLHEHGTSPTLDEDDMLIPDAAMLEEAREEYGHACNHERVSMFLSFIQEAQDVFAQLDHQRQTKKRKSHYTGDSKRTRERQRALLKKMTKDGYPTVLQFFSRKTAEHVSI